MARRAALVSLAALAALALPAAARASSPVADEIVVMRPGGLTAGELARADVSAERALPIAGVEVVAADAGRARALAALRSDPDVAWAEPNRTRRIAAEPLAGLLWGLENTGQSVWWRRGTPDADIDAPEAWATTRGAGVTIAVADTGVDLGHPDLAGRLVPGRDFVDDDSEPADAHGHGTHVAGTIAAGENGVGVVGVAPQAHLMPLRVLDASGLGSSADVAAAFAYAAEHGARVVNASLGSDSPSLAERRAIREHPGTLYVVAAGNDGKDDDASPEYPCSYPEPNVLCVGASDADDARAGFSNFGAASVDVFAPGEDVVSTYPRGRASALNRYFGTGDGYEVMQGTSMAAPHAAGAAALVADVRPSWGAAQVRAALLAGADAVPSMAGLAVSGGRLNAAGAVRAAAGASDARAPEPVAAAPAAPAGPAAAPPPAPPPPSVAPTIERMRISGRPRLCRRRGCGARRTVLSFELGAGADVFVRLQRRRCAGNRCRWRAAGTRTRRAPAGSTRWTLGPELLGMRLGRGSWRVTLRTSADRATRRFTVRSA